MRKTFIASLLLVVGILSCSGPTEPTPISSISIAASSTTMASGATLQLTAATLGKDGKALTNRVVTWSSSNTNIATVSATGLVTAGYVLGGTNESVTITATAEGITGKVVVDVTPSPVATITFTTETGTIGVGETLQLIATLKDVGGKTLTGRIQTWSSVNTNVASVSANGLLTAISPGTTTVTVETEKKSAAIAITAEFRVISLAAGRNRHTCALIKSGRVYCWGQNIVGQAGEGINWSIPTPVAGGLQFREIAQGSFFTCGITLANEGYCWGSNAYGQLGGNTDVLSTDQPQRIQLTDELRHISAGLHHVCTVTTQGAAYCWGNNAWSQVVGDTIETINRPVLIPIGSVDSIAAGDYHTCAVSTARKLYCWGWNSDGQIGDGTRNSTKSPVLISTNTDFEAVGVGETWTCALRSADKKVLCWGIGDEGQLGGGVLLQRNLIPQEVIGENKSDRMSVGPFHVCTVAPDKNISCWGWNRYGQLGDSSATSRSTPTLVVTPELFVSVSSGGLHTCAISVAGTPYCWGYNGNGQLGDGSTINSLVPKRVWK